jgi:hypothetical protein
VIQTFFCSKVAFQDNIEIIGNLFLSAFDRFHAKRRRFLLIPLFHSLCTRFLKTMIICGVLKSANGACTFAIQPVNDAMGVEDMPAAGKRDDNAIHLKLFSTNWAFFVMHLAISLVSQMH